MNPDLVGVGLMNETVLSSGEEMADQACIRALEAENRALRSQLEQRDQEIAALTKVVRKANRMEKGLDLIQKWAEERQDEFLIDLIDLIDG